MAWLEKDRHGRLRIGFKYYDGLKCREPLGVSANKQTIAEARRLCGRYSSYSRQELSTMPSDFRTAIE
jgi:hypothetical protein